MNLQSYIPCSKDPKYLSFVLGLASTMELPVVGKMDVAFAANSPYLTPYVHYTLLGVGAQGLANLQGGKNALAMDYDMFCAVATAMLGGVVGATAKGRGYL
ncbi:MAG: hypothetical protein CMO41_04405 [Verrucomicrobiales bacterium]|nr:hypothetical protein [Verrucomicrobiales bacterium]|tara:strand:+ start:1241 stop:1543 length:303 start_codon:yes stop_codon:yes gene_type:complete